MALNIPDVRRSMSGPEYAAFTKMMGRLQNKQRRHNIRKHYYDGTSVLKDLGISTPPNLRDMDVALGWPAKAVDSLSKRTNLEGFVLPGSDIEDFGIDDIWRDNRLNVESPQVHTSAMIHSVAFLATLLGDVANGEPPVLIQAFDAQNATGLWQPTTRTLGAALLVIDRDPVNGPTKMVVIFPHVVYTVTKTSGSYGWAVSSIPNTLGRVPVEPLAFNPRLGRPFGQSRLSRAVMSLTDSAMRTVVRSEVGAEFFSAPQRYLLGADMEMFMDDDGNMTDSWSILTGRLLAIPEDEDGNKPELGQFSQISMQPHESQLAMWSRLFAGETNLPVGSLGIVTDNPASAESIYAVKEDLLIDAEAAMDGFTSAWVNSMKTAIQLRDGLLTLPTELNRLSVRWRDPSTPSRSQATDATTKLISVGVLPPTSPVTYELLGFSEVDIQRLEEERKREAAPNVLESLLGRASNEDPEAAVKDAQIMRSKADALGLLRRAGVEADSAAQLVGLENVTFIPGQPITIRAPEDA